VAALARGAREFGEVLSDGLQDLGFRTHGSMEGGRRAVYKLHVTDPTVNVVLSVNAAGEVAIMPGPGSTGRRSIESALQRLGLGKVLVPSVVEELRVVIDDDTERADLSYLEHEVRAGTAEEREAAQERLEAFHRGLWHMVGIYAVANVDVAGQTEQFRSPGLWGIESDSGRDYFQHVGRDEYNELARDLRQMGVTRIPAFKNAEWSTAYPRNWR
jgi:hypothetical protein